MRLSFVSPRMAAVPLLLAAIALTVSGCGRRGSPTPVKAETAVQAERRSSAQVVEERARLGVSAPPATVAPSAPVDTSVAPFPSDAPSRIIENRPTNSFFLDFLL